MASSAHPELSIVVPAHNEALALPALQNEILRALGEVNASFEVLYVDDGSTDDTFAVLSRIASREPRVRVLRLRRRSGKAMALAVGFDRARGTTVVTLDGDLQDDPADIPAMLAKLDEGYDVVSGWRRKRRDRLLDRRLPSIAANRLISAVTGVSLHDYGSGLKAYRRAALRGVLLPAGWHRFLPALCSDGHPRVVEVVVHHRPRTLGRSKYGLSRIPEVIADTGVLWLVRQATCGSGPLARLGLALRRHQERTMKRPDLVDCVEDTSRPRDRVERRREEPA